MRSIVSRWRVELTRPTRQWISAEALREPLAERPNWSARCRSWWQQLSAPRRLVLSAEVAWLRVLPGLQGTVRERDYIDWARSLWAAEGYPAEHVAITVSPIGWGEQWWAAAVALDDQAALQSLARQADAHRAVPYFIAACERHLADLKAAAWVAVIEPGWLSVGLFDGQAWRAMSQRRVINDASMGEAAVQMVSEAAAEIEDATRRLIVIGPERAGGEGDAFYQIEWIQAEAVWLV